MTDTWQYRGHKLRQIEWGLWRDTCHRNRYLLCYRPRGKHGPVVRRWATTNTEFTLDTLKSHVRQVHAAAQQAKLGIEPTGPVAIDPQTALDRYIAALRQRGRNTQYIDTNKGRIDRFLAWAIDNDEPLESLDQITVAQADRFLQHLQTKKRGAATRNQYRTLLIIWLNWCVSRNLLAANPLTRLETIAEHRKLIQYPMPDELVTICRQLDRYDAQLATFLTLTGLRRGSLISLRPDSFRSDGILVPWVKPGGEWFLRFDSGCPLWRPDVSDLGRAIWQAEPPTLNSLRPRLKAIRQAAGTGLGFHGFRHAFASWLAMMAEPLEDIAAWLGHASPNTTRTHYAHLRPHGRANIESNRRKVFTSRSQLMAICLGENKKGLA